MAEVLVRTFQDLRTGRTAEGASLNRPDAVMSTAEAVNVMHAAALEAARCEQTKATTVTLEGPVLEETGCACGHGEDCSKSAVAPDSTQAAVAALDRDPMAEAADIFTWVEGVEAAALGARTDGATVSRSDRI